MYVDFYWISTNLEEGIPKERSRSFIYRLKNTKRKKENKKELFCLQDLFCRLHLIPGQLEKILKRRGKEWRVDPDANIIGRMHFGVVENHEDDLLAVDDHKACFIVCVPHFCDAADVLHGVRGLFGQCRCDSHLDSAFFDLFKDRLQALDFPHETLGGGHDGDGLFCALDREFKMIVEVVSATQASRKVGRFDEFHTLCVQGVELVDDFGSLELFELFQ